MKLYRTAFRGAKESYRYSVNTYPTRDKNYVAITVLVCEQTPCAVLLSLSCDVFERRTSTGSEPLSLLMCLNAAVFVLLSVVILIETICPKICSKSRLKSLKRPLPVDVRRSKTSLLTLPMSWRSKSYPVSECEHSLSSSLTCIIA